jgi:hypothetical protein
VDEAVRVKCGPRDDDTIPLTWAEAMLQELRSAHPLQFGKLLAKIAVGDR